MRILGSVAIASVFLAATPVRAEVVIDHKEVGCVAAGKFPRFEARFDPADAVARARLHFKPEGWPHWYSVPMRQEGASFFGVLPKPDKQLQKFDYYISVLDQGLAESRTAEHAPSVVSGPGGCQRDRVLALALKKAAQVVVSGPEGIANAPLVPAGFSTDGVVAGVAGPSGAPAVGASGTGEGAGAAAAGAGGVAAAGGAAAGSGISTALLVVGGLAVAGGAAAVAASNPGGQDGGKQQPPEVPPAPEVPLVEVRGQVFATFGPNPDNPLGPGLYSNPVAGALVSTSLDSATTRTDGDGRFVLITQTRLRNAACTPFTLTITAAGRPTYSVAASWGGGGPGFTFSLAPPLPMPFVGTCAS